MDTKITILDHKINTHPEMERNSLFYMANLGSEVSRALLEYEKKDYEKMRNSITRAKDIMTKIEEFELKIKPKNIWIIKKQFVL